MCTPNSTNIYTNIYYTNTSTNSILALCFKPVSISSQYALTTNAQPGLKNHTWIPVRFLHSDSHHHIARWESLLVTSFEGIALTKFWRNDIMAAVVSQMVTCCFACLLLLSERGLWLNSEHWETNGESDCYLQPNQWLIVCLLLSSEGERLLTEAWGNHHITVVSQIVTRNPVAPLASVTHFPRAPTHLCNFPPFQLKPPRFASKSVWNTWYLPAYMSQTPATHQTPNYPS